MISCIAPEPNVWFDSNKNQIKASTSKSIITSLRVSDKNRPRRMFCPHIKFVLKTDCIFQYFKHFSYHFPMFVWYDSYYSITSKLNVDTWPFSYFSVELLTDCIQSIITKKSVNWSLSWRFSPDRRKKPADAKVAWLVIFSMCFLCTGIQSTRFYRWL